MSKEQVLDWIIQHKKWVIGVWIVVVGVGLVVLVWQGGFLEETKVEVIQAQATPVEERKMNWVDISGEVVKPGVYSFEATDRVVNAIEKAGGLGKDADVEWVEKNLNKAAKLVDGQKIYIPRKNDKIQITNDNSSSNMQNLKINLNSSTQTQLESLPGVGPATAIKIINGRPYGDVGELVSKKVVSQKVFEQIKDLVSVW